MAVRQDWTRLTRTVHDFLLLPHFETRKDVAVGKNRRLLAEIERRKGRAITNNVRNQLR